MSFGFGLGFGFGAGQGGFDLASLWANGEAATLYEADKMDTLFLDSRGAYTLTSDAETVGFSLDTAKFDGLSLSNYLATLPEKVVNGGFDTDTVWSKAAGSSISDGIAHCNAPSFTAVFSQSQTFVVGELYRTAYNALSVVRENFRCSVGGTVGQTIASPRDHAEYFVATATSGYSFVGTGNGVEGTFDDASLKKIPAKYAIQSTASAEPAWKTGGFLRHDGFDDGQLTNVYCGSGGNTLAQKMTLPPAGASTKCTAGLSGSSTARFYLGHLDNGKLAAGVGSHTTATIFGGDDIGGETGVAVLTEDGSTVNLYWNAELIYTGAQSGAPSTSVPFARGYLNNNGTPAIHCAIDEYKFLHLDYAATAAQVASITAKWS